MADLNWQWTNDERTEARAGAWTVVPSSHRDIVVRHDDFPGSEWVENTLWGNLDKAIENKYTANRRTAALVAKSFLAWANSQPTRLEHRDGEYVHFRWEGSDQEYVYEFSDDAWWRSHHSNGIDVGLRNESQSALNAWVLRHTVLSHGFLAPGTVMTPQPPEPTTFGYVGSVTESDGTVWDVLKDHDGNLNYLMFPRDNRPHIWRNWQDVLALGTFEAKS